MTSGKGHNPRLAKSRMFGETYSGGQWTIAEAKLASSLCIRMNRRFPFPLCILFPGKIWKYIDNCHSRFTYIYLRNVRRSQRLNWINLPIKKKQTKLKTITWKKTQIHKQNLFMQKTSLKVLATIPYFNFHFFSHLLIFLQFRDPFYILNLSTKAVLHKWHN